MFRQRRNQIALGLAVTVFILAIVSTLLASLARDNGSGLVQALGVIAIALFIVTLIALAITVVSIIVKARFHPRFGMATLIVALALLPVAILLQVAINILLVSPSPARLALSTLLWAMWIAWVVGSVALTITWVATALRKQSGADGVRDRVVTSAAMQPGWYPDPGGSGRMRWFDGVVWRDEYGDAPTP